MSLVKLKKVATAPKAPAKTTAKAPAAAKAPANTPAPAASSTAAAKSISTGAKNTVMDRSFYQDNMNLSAKEAIKNAQSSSLFKLHKNTGVEGGSETISGLDCVARGGRYKIEMDTDDDGELEEVSAAEAMAASFDSELDLYIEDVLHQAIEKFGTKFYWGGSFKSQEAQDFFAQHGIRVDQINNRTYTFSLVDDEGNVLEDSEGGKGSILFGDWVIPDGYAQGSELNLSSLLDQMGYDCISKADFIGHEDDYNKVLAAVQENLDKGLYEASERKVSDIYGGATTSFSTGHAGSSGSGANGLGSGESGLINKNEQAKEEEKIKQAKEDEAKLKSKVQRLYDTLTYENKSDETISSQDIMLMVAQQLKITTQQVAGYVK